MKLHRLRLRNFRGITDRDCVFADRGVTVVSGRNEAGKSSMVEALDLLLDVPSGSKSRRVQTVQPAGCDVGTEIEAEISCGPWRFTYAKVFNKGQSTSLRIVAPRPEQLTGKAAHERATAILGEAVDLALLRAARVVQGSAGTAVAMSEAASVTRALDRAVADRPDGDPGNGSGDAADGLLTAVEEQYVRYYTAGRGQPTGELLDAIKREKSVRAELTQLDAALAAIDDDVARVGRLTRRRKQIDTAVEQLKVDLEQAEVVRKAADDLRDRLAAATSRAEVAALRRGALVGEQELRARTAKKIAELTAVRDESQGAKQTAQTAVEAATVRVEQAERARVEAGAALTRARSRVEAAELGAELAAKRADLAAALDRLQRVEKAQRAQGERLAALAANTVDAQVLAVAVQLRDSLLGVEARLNAVATSMRVIALGDHPVTVNGAEVGAGEISVVDDIVLEVPGVLRVELASGADTTGLAEQRHDLEGRVAGLCASHGVGDIAALIVAGEERRTLAAAVTVANAEVDRLHAGETVEQLRKSVGRLRDEVGAADAVRVDAIDGPADPTGEPAGLPDLPALRAAERACTATCLTAERGASQYARILVEHSAAVDRTGDAAARATADLSELTTAQDLARAAKPDADLAVDLAAAVAEVAEREASVQQVRSELEAADAVELERRITAMDDRLEAIAAERAAGEREVAQALARIDLCREDARRDRRDEVAAAHSAAQADLARITARADAAKLLRETLIRHRAEAHARYSEPFRRRVEELAEPLFGPDVRFDVDDALGITARTLGGATVSFDELSMGAREQIGIIARLACAMLVDEADGVPVNIDDALGHSDADRVAQMARVLTRAGEQAQVIVLTCAPERYREVQTASIVAL